ncbi:DUF1775 domain-containing protein [Cryobacterium melibiosiphilum]|uniref:DUF1775 domain-containing protein n=1 Tax=Cryobacterium melibiosiphilum TaxID=995039 RepID=A0A3A5MHB3_9MICO|nr:YcnI family protein [Cryobacterium melibiosiphilum]RJT89570.1 DUF1775 domain-containing protein [Cryobacterium melibiosiphilum]
MKRSSITLAAAVAAGAFLALSAPLAASAHVSVEPASTAAGSYTVLTFSNAHGCDGSPTTGITIDIPEGIDSVSPTINPGWTAAKVMDGDRVGQVTYTAETPLEDGYRTTFALSLQLPADAEGETLAFPVLQSCEIGETSWSEATVEGEEEPAHPAPVITVTEASADEHGHSDATAASTDDHADTATTETTAAGSASSTSGDVLARVLGIGGLAVGAVGIVLAVTARRKTQA